MDISFGKRIMMSAPESAISILEMLPKKLIYKKCGIICPERQMRRIGGR